MEKAIEIKYIEEIEELILKINLLAYRMGSKTKHDVFVRYSSHVNYLEIEVCINGWEMDKEIDYRPKQRNSEGRIARNNGIFRKIGGLEK